MCTCNVCVICVDLHVVYVHVMCVICVDLHVVCVHVMSVCVCHMFRPTCCMCTCNECVCVSYV